MKEWRHRRWRYNIVYLNCHHAKFSSVLGSKKRRKVACYGGGNRDQSTLPGTVLLKTMRGNQTVFANGIAFEGRIEEHGVIYIAGCAYQLPAFTAVDDIHICPLPCWSAMMATPYKGVWNQYRGR